MKIGIVVLLMGLILLVAGCVKTEPVGNESIKSGEPIGYIEPPGFGQPLPDNYDELPSEIKDIYNKLKKENLEWTLYACKTTNDGTIYKFTKMFGEGALYKYYHLTGILITEGEVSDVPIFKVDGKESFYETKVPETKECKKIESTETKAISVEELLAKKEQLVRHKIAVRGQIGFENGLCTEMFCSFEENCTKGEEKKCNTCGLFAAIGKYPDSIELRSNQYIFDCSSTEIIVCQGETRYDIEKDCSIEAGEEYEITGTLGSYTYLGGKYTAYYLEVENLNRVSGSYSTTKLK